MPWSAAGTLQDATVNALGTQLSHDVWRVVDAALTYSQNGFWNGTSSATLDLAQGIPGLGATPDGSPNLSRPNADTTFTKITSTLRRVQGIYGPVSAAFIVQGQYAFQPIVVGEQISFGGGTNLIGRAYDPSAIAGDMGVGASAELRYDFIIGDSWVQTIEPYGFYDTAKEWDHIANTGGGLWIASTGGGVRFSLKYNVNADFEIGKTLHAVPGSDNGQTTTKFLFNAGIRF